MPQTAPPLQEVLVPALDLVPGNTEGYAEGYAEGRKFAAEV